MLQPIIYGPHDHILHICPLHLPDTHAVDLPNTGLGLALCDGKVGCSEKNWGFIALNSHCIVTFTD